MLQTTARMGDAGMLSVFGRMRYGALPSASKWQEEVSNPNLTTNHAAFMIDESLNFSIYLILSAAICPMLYSTSNRNEYQKKKKKILRSRARPVCNADNLTAICDPIV
jgi:hypothetical protein